MVFMDGSNIYHGMKTYAASIGTPDYNIDFHEFIAQVVKGQPLVRVIYYCSKKVPPDPGKVQFVDCVRKLGTEDSEESQSLNRSLAT